MYTVVYFFSGHSVLGASAQLTHVKKTIEQSRVREGSPMDGVGSIVGRITGKGNNSDRQKSVLAGLNAQIKLTKYRLSLTSFQSNALRRRFYQKVSYEIFCTWSCNSRNILYFTHQSSSCSGNLKVCSVANSSDTQGRTQEKLRGEKFSPSLPSLSPSPPLLFSSLSILCPFPFLQIQIGGLGSAVSSPCGVWGGAQLKLNLVHFK